MKNKNETFFSRNLRYIKILIVAILCILFYVLIANFSQALEILKFILDVASPIIIGFSIAFILNMPLKLFENVIFKKLTRKNGKIWSKIKRPLCITLSILLIISVFTLLLAFILPTVVSEVRDFFLFLPDHIKNLNESINSFMTSLQLPGDFSFDIDVWSAISAAALDFLTQDGGSVTAGAIGLILALFSGVVNFILGFALSIYVLASKEKLGKLAKSILYSIFNRRRARKIISVALLTNKAFSGFIAGQCLEVLVVGILCFLGMIIFQFPITLALMVSCIVGLTNFVPIFGPFVGTAIGAFIILLSETGGGFLPALMFVVYIIVMQQIESNVLYPKFMGVQVGLPGLWVLIAVTLGGGFFGVPGIIVSVPLFSVFYTLLHKWIITRLEKKKICHVNNDDNTNQENSSNVEISDDMNVIISAEDVEDIVATNKAAEDAVTPKDKK